VTDPRVVLDASAVLAWVLHESGADVVERLLPAAAIPAANLTEVLYRAPERGHGMTMEQLEAHLLAKGLTIESVTPDDARRAAELIRYSRDHRRGRRDSGLSLGDALCIAVAERLELPISGGDTAWEHVPINVDYHPFR
jgi:ribonuclease VapC